MAIYTTRESLNTAAQNVALTYVEQDGKQVLMGSERSLPVLDISHQRLHEGRAFLAYRLYPSTAKLADGATVSIAIACAENCELHMLVQAECGGEAEFYWYENATVSAGTAFTPINRKRSSTRTSEAAVLINPTVTSAGTELMARSIPGGSGVFAGGGSDYSFEFVLKGLTTYLFQMKNTSGSARAAHLMLEWYE
jgi:hypothetical protein